LAKTHGDKFRESNISARKPSTKPNAEEREQNASEQNASYGDNDEYYCRKHGNGI
jgi:hypothetical protein